MTDWKWYRIPNQVTYPTMVVGIVLGALEGIPGQAFSGGLLDHVAGLIIAFLVAYPFYAAGGLKPGDGKLLMAVGALRGSMFLLTSALYGALAGGALALVLIGVRRLAPPEGQDEDERRAASPRGVRPDERSGSLRSQGPLPLGPKATREKQVRGAFWRVMKSRIPYGVALGMGALIALALEVAAG